MTMTSPNPAVKSPERAFALQKYLLLHSQHDALQKHLNQVTATIPSSPTSPTDRHRNSSISSTSSIGSDRSFSPLSSTRTTRARRDSLPSSFGHMQHFHRETRINSLPVVVDETMIEEIEEEEQKLKNVNQQIKTTLTDLLNCESVKSDLRYRKWVQTRLMDTERELKEGRSKSCERRRSEDMSFWRDIGDGKQLQIGDGWIDGWIDITYRMAVWRSMGWQDTQNGPWKYPHDGTGFSGVYVGMTWEEGFLAFQIVFDTHAVYNSALQYHAFSLQHGFSPDMICEFYNV